MHVHVYWKIYVGHDTCP